jgi:hypothetical protein
VRYVQARGRLVDPHIHIEGSPAFHALHREALKDQELPRAPLPWESALVRRRAPAWFCGDGPTGTVAYLFATV